jgi:hypothetical protein
VAILVKEQSLPIDQETFNGALLLRVRWQVAATPLVTYFTTTQTVGPVVIPSITREYAPHPTI